MVGTARCLSGFNCYLKSGSKKIYNSEMINKYFIILGLVILIVIGGAIYRKYILPESSLPVQTGKTINVAVVAERDEWRFTPEEIIAERGDKIIMKLVNEDDYDHGIAIDAFGVSQRMPANSTIT